MSAAMGLMYEAITELMDACVKELKRSNNKLDTTDLTVDQARQLRCCCSVNRVCLSATKIATWTALKRALRECAPPCLYRHARGGRAVALPAERAPAGHGGVETLLATS